MKILFLSEQLPPDNPGGGGKCAWEVLHGLAWRNCDTLALCRARKTLRIESHKNILIHRLPPEIPFHRYAATLLRSQKFDVFLDEGCLTGTPELFRVLQTHRLPIICRPQVLAESLALSLKRGFNCNEGTKIFLHNFLLNQKCEFNRSRRIICASRYDMDILRNHLPHLKNRVCGPLMHGTNFSQYADRALKKSRKAVNIFFYTRPCMLAHFTKGTDRVAAVFKSLSAEFRNIHLTICCRGKDAYLQQLLWQLPRVKLLPWTHNTHRYLNFLKTMDIILCPARHETGGMVALEGMALGKTVIATDVGGLREIIKDKKTGYLVQEDDNNEKIIQRLTTLIKRIVRNSELQKFSQSGPSWANEKFSFDPMMDAYSRILKNALSIKR